MNGSMIKFRFLAVKSWPNITRLLAQRHLFVIRLQNLLFDVISAFHANGVGDIRV
jgi:hypothetical protein